mgnify:CR=1 FL=1
MPLSSAIRATVGILLVVPLLSGCSLLFVEGPAPGWRDANAEDLLSMSISQPCTNSKILTTIDAVSAAVNGVYGIVGLFASNAFKGDYPAGYWSYTDFAVPYTQSSSEEALMYRAIASLIWSPIQAISAVKGRNRVNDCRAFNVRLSEEQR